MWTKEGRPNSSSGKMGKAPPQESRTAVLSRTPTGRTAEKSWGFAPKKKHHKKRRRPGSKTSDRLVETPSNNKQNKARVCSGHWTKVFFYKKQKNTGLPLRTREQETKETTFARKGVEIGAGEAGQVAGGEVKRFVDEI